MQASQPKGLVTIEHLNRLKTIVGESYVFADEENLVHYGHDETEHLSFLPEVVIKPRTT